MLADALTTFQVAVQIALDTGASADEHAPAPSNDGARVPAPAIVEGTGPSSAEPSGMGASEDDEEIGDCPYGAGDAKQYDANGKLLHRAYCGVHDWF